MVKDLEWEPATYSRRAVPRSAARSAPLMAPLGAPSVSSRRNTGDPTGLGPSMNKPRVRTGPTSSPVSIHADTQRAGRRNGRPHTSGWRANRGPLQRVVEPTKQHHQVGSGSKRTGRSAPGRAPRDEAYVSRAPTCGARPQTVVVRRSPSWGSRSRTPSAAARTTSPSTARSRRRSWPGTGRTGRARS